VYRYCGSYMLTCHSVCATGALRVHYAHRLMYYTRINPSPTYDISWEALGSWVSTCVETNVAIICASLPALNAYFKGWFGVTGHQERSFGWYNHPRWSPWSSAQKHDQGSQSTSLGCMSHVKTPDEVIEAVRVPCRAYDERKSSTANNTRHEEFLGSVDSDGTLNRQDSIAPILRRG
jgi:hypothetical protein